MTDRSFFYGNHLLCLSQYTVIFHFRLIAEHLQIEIDLSWALNRIFFFSFWCGPRKYFWCRDLAKISSVFSYYLNSLCILTVMCFFFENLWFYLLHWRTRLYIRGLRSAWTKTGYPFVRQTWPWQKYCAIFVSQDLLRCDLVALLSHRQRECEGKHLK